MIGEPPAQFDPELEAALSALDEALCAGRDTDELKRLVGVLSGDQAAPLLSTLNLLHDVWQSSRQVAFGRGSTLRSHVDPTAETRVDDGIPSTFGRFEILRRIGAGGSGLVFQARDPRLRRVVALKIPRAETLFSTEARRRFEREAELVAALNHPSIIPVFEAGEADGVPYIVEEYSAGTNLAEWLRRKQDVCESMSCRLAAQLLSQVADALAEAHACGIVHRDLKPANILLEDNSAGDAADVSERPLLPRITDFGIAKLSSQFETLTATHAIVGTAAYMPPEQARGGTRDMGPPGDVYSLGVILYELLAGRRPFVDESDVRLLRRIVEDEPPPVHRLRPDVPRDLSAVCMKCLEKTPARRYRTAAELRDDLQRFLDGRPVSARSISSIQRGIRWCRRRPVHATLLFVVVVSALAAATGTWFHVESLNTALEREQGLRRQTEQLKSAVERNLTTAESRGAELQRQVYCQDSRDAWRLISIGKGLEARAILDKYADDPSVSSSFCWSYMRRLCQLDDWSALHGSQVYSIEFSPDDRHVAIGIQGKSGIIRDAKTSQEVFRLSGHTDCVNAVRYSPDGRTLWTASCDGTIRSWDAADGRPLAVLSDRGKQFETLMLSPDGRFLAAGEQSNGEPSRLLLWKLDEQRLVGEVDVSEERIESIAFSADGTQLAVAANDVAWVFDVDSRLEQSRREGGTTGRISAAAFLPGSNTVVWGKSLWGVGEWFELSELDGERPDTRYSVHDPCRVLAISPDGTKVLSGGDRGVIDVVDIVDGQVHHVAQHTGSRVTSLAVSHDGECFAAGGLDESVQLYRFDALQEVQRTLDRGTFSKLSLTDGGRALVIYGIRHEIRGYDLGGWSRRFEFSAPNECIVPGSHNGSQFATLDNVTAVFRRRDARTGALVEGSIRTFDFNERRPHESVRLSPDGTRLFVVTYRAGASDPCRIEEWSLRNGGEMRIIARPPNPANSIAVHNQVLAYSSRHEPTFVLVDVNSGEELWHGRDLPAIYAHCFSPDGQLLAVAAHNRQVYVLQTANGEQQGVLKGCEGIPRSLVFTPDGRQLVCGDDSGLVCIWDVAARQQLMSLQAHNAPVFALEMTPDGLVLVTAGASSDGSGATHVWSARAPAR